MFTYFFLKMLNREAASPKHKSERIIESLHIQEGYTIADIGAGGGYFTLNGMDLPESALDLIFARNVFHHLSEPGKYIRNLKRFLKPSGKVAIIDHKPKGGFSFVSLFRHHTPEEVILQEMENAGYYLVESFDFLSEQTFSLLGVELFEGTA